MAVKIVISYMPAGVSNVTVTVYVLFVSGNLEFLWNFLDLTKSDMAWVLETFQ